MDGSAAAASFPATCRAPRQTAESLHKHTRNTKARTGKRLRTPARKKSDRRESPPAPSIVLFLKRFCSFRFPLLPRQQPQKFRFDLRKSHRRCRACRMYHDVPSWSNLPPVQPQNFSHSPPNPVAHHRRPQRLFNAHSKTPALEPVLARKNHKIPARTPPPFAIYRVELRLPHQPRLPRPIIRLAARRILPLCRCIHIFKIARCGSASIRRLVCRGKSSGRSNAGQRVPPLRPPSHQHLPSILRFHSRAKPMLLVSPPYMRLKSGLRQRIFSLF